MSKIEKALNRARQNDGKAMVPVASPRVGSVDSPRPDEVRTTAESGSELVPARSNAKAIARMNEPWQRKVGDLAELRIISQELSGSPTLEVFRDLRTRILQVMKGQNGIILVTSVVGDSGNSFAALNLGASFALDASRTALVVDCNLRRPSLHRLLGDQPKAGIADYLESSDMDIGEIVHPVGIDRLRVVPAGVEHDKPMEYFTSQRARQLLLGLRNRYADRFVILDAPPMTESADTQILMALCDYILVVVPYGRVSNVQVDTCLKLLDRSKLLGVVFNNEPQIPEISWHSIVQGVKDAAGQLIGRSKRA